MHRRMHGKNIFFWAVFDIRDPNEAYKTTKRIAKTHMNVSLSLRTLIVSLI